MTGLMISHFSMTEIYARLTRSCTAELVLHVLLPELTVKYLFELFLSCFAVLKRELRFFLSLETNKPLILYILIFKRSLIAEYFVL